MSQLIPVQSKYCHIEGHKASSSVANIENPKIWIFNKTFWAPKFKTSNFLDTFENVGALQIRLADFQLHHKRFRKKGIRYNG